MQNITIKGNSQPALVANGAQVLQATNLMHTDRGLENNGQNPLQGIIVPQGNAVFSDPSELVSANGFEVPTSVTVVVASDNAAGGAATRVYVFNQATLNNVTTNGSAAASIVYTYQDGFAGRCVSDIIGLSRMAVGAVCYGISLRMITTTTGAGSAASLAVSNPRFDTNNALGSALPLNLNINVDQTRKDTDTSIGVIRCVRNIPKIAQFSFIIPQNTTATCTFNFVPNFSV